MFISGSPVAEVITNGDAKVGGGSVTGSKGGRLDAAPAARNGRGARIG